jgi:hypothetical protein
LGHRLCAILLALTLSLIPAPGRSSDFVLSGFVEAGSWFTTQDYEEDLDEDFSYQYYHLKFEEKLSTKSKYSLSSFLYNKNYDSLDSLDNLSRTLNLLWSYDAGKSGAKTFGLDLALGYRGKRYQDNKASDYDKVYILPSAVFVLKDNLKLDFSLGVENFNYLAGKNKDEFKFLGRIGCERFFEKKQLRLGLGYKLENLSKSQPGRKKSKQDVSIGAVLNPKTFFLSGLALKITFGQRDTKDEEDRDQDYDYCYRSFLIRTKHKLKEKLSTDFEGEYFKKTYTSARLGYHFYRIANSWDYQILDNQRHRVSLEIGLEHKNVDYLGGQRSDYRKETFKTKLNFQTKKDWKLGVGAEENFYIYETPDKDKNRTYFVFSLEKSFLERRFLLQADFKVRFTDYKYQNDQEQKAARLGFEYRF